MGANAVLVHLSVTDVVHPLKFDEPAGNSLVRLALYTQSSWMFWFVTADPSRATLSAASWA